MKIVEIFGLDVEKLRNMMNANVNESNINEDGRLDELKWWIRFIEFTKF